MTDFVKPFGPWIMVDRVSDELLARLNDIGDRVLADADLGQQLDWSHHLAGNVDREVLVPFADEAERAWALGELREKARRYYQWLVSQDCVPRPQDPPASAFRFEGMWMVNQLAGDFNPAHMHGGDFSAVLYLRLPPGMEAEWAAEDHHPTAGYLEFIDGRPNRFARTGYRVRPQPGMLLLFPAWLLHTVYPFRSAGDRRSLSFNIVIDESAPQD